MCVRLYDGNNAYRLQLENDPTGLAPRTLWNDAQNTNDVCIWVWDGVRNNERRRAIFPGYKSNRKPPAEDIFAGMNLARDVLKHSKALQIQVPEYEADDVIAAIACDLAGKQLVQIYSNDFDLYQLTALPGVVCGARPREGVSPGDVRLFKTFVGDPSDTIPGVRGFGVATWHQADKRALRKVIESLSDDLNIDLDALDQTGVGSRVKREIHDNPGLIHSMWQITGFFDVPKELINKHTFVGQPDKAAADALLSEFFL